MKEIWMEKLIELLNEYEKKNVVHRYERYEQSGILMCKYIKEDFTYYADEASTLAISKYYGFIQRLVDNDKIDIEKEIKNSELNWLHEHYLREDCLLMLLSISDTPIDDLISYLK